jgi:hypothetical protein
LNCPQADIGRRGQINRRSCEKTKAPFENHREIDE